jgi:hypothetical protein
MWKINFFTSKKSKKLQKLKKNATIEHRHNVVVREISRIQREFDSFCKFKSIKCKRIINHLFYFSFFSTADHEAPSKTTTSTKQRAPSPPTVRVGHNRLDVSHVSQSLDIVTSTTTVAPISNIHDTVRSTISTGSFDYLKAPRRCVLKVDRNKGLGFVLSATGDYDHTITAVEKVSKLS